MEKIVKKFLQNKNISLKNEKIIVGFSGGHDSMALANILINLSNELGFYIILAHLNHNWRGYKSLKEEKNCQKFAKEKRIEFYSETLPKDIPHTETAAREERYAFFERVAKKYNSTIILTAHTKSDNIETVIQRIIKGTAISGLQGIKDTRDLTCAKVYRPLLECSREDILKYCKENKLKPNNDNSNKNTKYFRNRIRHKLLPELKTNYDANIENAICRLIQNATDEEKIINEYITKELTNIFEEDTILTKKFEKLSYPLKKRIIKEKILEENNFDYDQKRINDILEFIENASNSKAGKTFSLGTDVWLYTNWENIEIIDKTKYINIFTQTELNLEGETYIKELDATIKITKWEGEKPTIFPKSEDNIAYIDLTQIQMPLYIRTRIPGDKIVPFGKNSPIKLKKYLTNKNLSKHDKSKVLLISSSTEVLWVINLGISNNIKVNGMPTHTIEIIRSNKNG